MIISQDMFVQCVNRGEHDVARKAIEAMVSDNHSFDSFTSTNAVRALVKLAMNSDDLSIPNMMLRRHYLEPACGQLIVMIRMETSAALSDQEDMKERLGQAAINLLKAAAHGAPDNLKNQTLNALIQKLLQGKYPREIGMHCDAFKPYRDAYLTQDLGL